MLDTVVRYLHQSLVPFRLSSYPSPEAEPKAAHRAPAGGIFVETEVVLVNEQPVLVCVPEGHAIDLVSLGAALGGLATKGSMADLPTDLQHASMPPPPLGQLFGVPLVVDERVTQANVVSFRVFGDSDYIDLPYENLAVLEQPRILTVVAGELPVGTETGSRAR